MLVAHAVAKRFKQSLRESLRDAWRWFKSGSRNFTEYLRMTIKNKRLRVLEGVDVRNIILGQSDNTKANYSPLGWLWSEIYNILFV